MSKSHNEPVDDVWADFYATNPKRAVSEETAQADQEAARAESEAKYQEIERWNAYLIHKVLGLPQDECPYLPPPHVNLDRNIRTLPTYTAATLFLRPSRVQQLIDSGASESEAALIGDPFILFGEPFPERTNQLIDTLMEVSGATHDTDCELPNMKVWKATIQSNAIEFILQTHELLMPTPEDETATAKMFSLYARKEHKPSSSPPEYGHLSPRYRRIRNEWQ
jgi:hypothetical protein